MKNQLEESKELLLQFEKRGGLLPTIVQDVESKEILMLGYSNKVSFVETIKLNMATFWSTSRDELWTKGKTSGDYLEIKEIRTDCDQDALIYIVERKGSGACHTKAKDGNARTTCFYRKLDNEVLAFIKGLE